MKILMINSVCGIGSTGRICTDLADALSKNGHEVKIAYGRGNAPDKYATYAVRIGNELNVRMHALVSRVFDNTGYCSKKATERLIEWVKDYNPDVIHLHNIHGYYINIEVLFNYLSKANKRVIWTLHDCWPFTGHCVYFSAIKCEKWKNGCDNCPQKKEYPSSLLLDRSAINWKRKKELFTSIKDMTLITPSEWLAGLVRTSFLGKYPVVVINNGIDTNVFKPTPSDFRQKYGLQNKRVLLGVSNQWTERKGFNDFIKLASMIDDDYRIVLVGLSQKQINILPSNMIGITRTQNTKELAEIYTAADVFLNLSVEETFGLTTVEALACGTPAIVYDATALSEIVEKNKVTIRDWKNLIKMVKKPYTERKLETKYDKKQMIDRYYAIYIN